MTPADLSRCTGARIDRAQRFLPYIEAAMQEYGIDTPARQAAFLAQIGHESGGLHFLVELWGPSIQQRGYGNRMGNAGPEEGFKFRGRGLIQLTGKNNYTEASAALGVDLIAEPERLGEPDLACRSAGWFWKSHGLNELADAGDFERVTKRINGGLNGYPERLALYGKAQEVLA
jgi:putative chitinase